MTRHDEPAEGDVAGVAELHATYGWDGATGYRCRCGQMLTERSWANAEPLWRAHVRDTGATERAQ